MGNSESMYESEDNFYQHPPYYAGSSVNDSYHQPSSYTGNLENTTYEESYYAGDYSNTTYNQPSTYTGSSANTRSQKKQQPTYIADNFSSLDQVSTATFAW